MENQGFEEEQQQQQQQQQQREREREQQEQEQRGRHPRGERSGGIFPESHCQDMRVTAFRSNPSTGNFPPTSADNHVYEDISSSGEDPSRFPGCGNIPFESRLDVPEGPRTYGLPVFEAVGQRVLTESFPQEQSSPGLSPSPDRPFHRNLTLPFRRGTALDPGTNCSVRVTSRERNEQDDQEATRDPPVADGRPGRRRRKKDCKHCRNRVTDSASPSLPDSRPPRDRKRQTDLEEECVPSVPSCPNPGAGIFGPLATSRVTTIRDRENGKTGASTVFSITETPSDSPASPIKFLELGRKEDQVRRNEDKPLILPEKSRLGMRVNSIYSQERWYAKEAPIFFTDVKEHAAFQRAYSLPVRTQSPASQNRVNLRRSVRGEPPPHPARLHKHRHGWTLHLARPLEGPSCTRPLIFLLILILALLGVGAIALYIVFEPEKLQIIQQYLRSSTENATSRNVHAGGFLVPSISEGNASTSTAIPESTSSTILLTGLLNDTSPFPEETSPSTEPDAEDLSGKNRTRYCDDCLTGEVCVALVDEEVPICRLGLDNQDPTGCAGFCLINKQRCHRLDVDAFRCVEVEHYCLDDEWTCSNTLCIPLEKHCDGHMNCYDHSDEYNCVCNLETHFQCGNETSCLPLEKRCDGKIDCWDAADEINCTLGRNLGLSCPMENEFTCSSGQCILKARFCDGLPDCVDGSDEPHGCQGRCNKHEFTCQNSRCITKGMKCNGVDDCGDGSDERHCKDRF